MTVICQKCKRECCTCSGCKSPDGKHCPGCYNIIQKEKEQNASNTNDNAVRQLQLGKGDGG